MSRSTVAVTFPDGTVRYALYNNTVDQLWPGLYDTEGEAWGEQYDAYQNRDWSAFKRLAFPEPTGEPQPVVITIDPGWAELATASNGRATHNAVVEHDLDD